MFSGAGAPGAAGKPGGSNKLFFMLPLMFISQKLPLTDEKFIQLLRVVYYTVQALIYSCTMYLKLQIEAHPDRNKKIYIPPPPPNPLAAFLEPSKEQGQDGNSTPESDPNAPKETTYLEHELDLLKQLQNSTFMGVVMATGLHFYMGVKPILFMQSCMGPLSLFENPLFKKYILGGGKVEEGLYGEVTDPSALVQEQSSTESSNSTSTKKTPKAIKEVQKGKKMMSEELLQRVLGAEEAENKCNASELEDIVDNYLTADNVDSITPNEGWTTLMVFCGHPNVTKSIMEKLLALKPNIMLQDEEGDTALHFAIGNSQRHQQDEAVMALLTDAGLSKEDKIKLINTKNKEEESAVDLCKNITSEIVKELIENELKVD